jgi:hypothetical protein
MVNMSVKKAAGWVSLNVTVESFVATTPGRAVLFMYAAMAGAVGATLANPAQNGSNPTMRAEKSGVPPKG